VSEKPSFGVEVAGVEQQIPVKKKEVHFLLLHF